MACDPVTHHHHLPYTVASRPSSVTPFHDWQYSCFVVHGHRRNNRRNRGDWSPSTFWLGDQQCIVPPQLIGRRFQKARNCTANSHQNAGFSIWVFKKIPGVIPPTLTAGGGNPLPHPTPSPAFGLVPSTFQPWLRPCSRDILIGFLTYFIWSEMKKRWHLKPEHYQEKATPVD